MTDKTPQRSGATTALVGFLKVAAIPFLFIGGIGTGSTYWLWFKTGDSKNLAALFLALPILAVGGALRGIATYLEQKSLDNGAGEIQDQAIGSSNIDSYEKLCALSDESPVLLFTYRGSPLQYSGLSGFQRDVLPRIDPHAQGTCIIACSNVGGVFRLSDLAHWLRKRKRRFRGCLLFDRGDLVGFKKVPLGSDDYMADAYVAATTQLLTELRARLER